MSDLEDWTSFRRQKCLLNVLMVLLTGQRSFMLILWKVSKVASKKAQIAQELALSEASFRVIVIAQL